MRRYVCLVALLLLLLLRLLLLLWVSLLWQWPRSLSRVTAAG